jgi:hypothetical protein
MPDRRVGTLDNPQRYAARCVSVYENSKGYYFKIDGVRESVHGNQLWTTLDNVKMRGSAQVDTPVVRAVQAPAPFAWRQGPQDEAEEERDLASAIQASLQEPEDVDLPALEDDQAAPAEDAPSSSEGGRDCAICLTEPSNHLMRPCNHLIACGRCARRLVRQPCPMCRRHVRSVERVFF